MINEDLKFKIMLYLWFLKYTNLTNLIVLFRIYPSLGKYCNVIEILKRKMENIDLTNQRTL